MAYTTFSNKLDAVTDVIATAAGHDAEVDGIQDEFEGRMEDFALNGVLIGMTGSISGTDIAIASGVAYVHGKKFVGSDTVSFTGAGADDYYVYIDPNDETSPYKKMTTASTDANLAICKVTWSGSALSALEDWREWGLCAWYKSFFTSGSVATGIQYFMIMPEDIWLEKVQLAVRTGPAGGSIIVDVHAGDAGAAPSTIWSEAANRPSIPLGGTAYQVYESADYIQVERKLDRGDVLYVEVDQADSAALDMTVLLIGRWLV